MLAVIDYGAGNLRSVLHALTYLGAEHLCIVQTPQELRGADKIILPGVGAFGAGMQQLAARQLIAPIQDFVQRGVPYLGICLGMQFLFERSDEMGDFAGLGLLAGDVTRFPAFPDLKVPHMGWNQINAVRPSPLLAGLADEGANHSAYFVHSYHC
ncbi:imidazole glycerol phosphate synthase subunit HisH, partial [bacterium]|nr:imidazole glycerol phosphate synthase subunit HisH [bacterium]